MRSKLRGGGLCISLVWTEPPLLWVPFAILFIYFLDCFTSSLRFELPLFWISLSLNYPRYKLPSLWIYLSLNYPRFKLPSLWISLALSYLRLELPYLWVGILYQEKCHHDHIPMNWKSNGIFICEWKLHELPNKESATLKYTQKNIFQILLNQPKSDCTYHFEIDLERNGRLFGSKSIGAW